MILPDISQNVAQPMDTNKQLASIRSYLSQLKEELEAELMNIGYDNLNKDLKNRIDQMSADILDQADEQYANFQYVKANAITTETLEAEYVKTSYLQANYLTASVIASTYVKTSVLEADYITASEIASRYVTADYLQANYITAGAISSTYLKTNNLTANLITSKFTSSGSGLFEHLNIHNMYVSPQGQGGRVLSLSFQSVVGAGGGTVYVLGTTQSPY